MDSDESVKTPIDDDGNSPDLDITANIRQQIIESKMSVDAQNVKVLTQNGKVTLRGIVETLEEKEQIENIAHDVAGTNNVDSQLEVE